MAERLRREMEEFPGPGQDGDVVDVRMGCWTFGLMESGKAMDVDQKDG